jgi:hypothetical protein
MNRNRYNIREQRTNSGNVAYKQEYEIIAHKLETRALLRGKSNKKLQILFAVLFIALSVVWYVCVILNTVLH